MAATPVYAQETYQMANLETQDLNGTARYVGMGGAMNALGADISVISSNPAGLAIMRSDQVSGTIGAVIQSGGGEFNNADKTNISFDQMGYVHSFNYGNSSRLNIAFNYHKSRNFSNILTAANSLYGDASQNKLTSLKFNEGIISSFDGAESYSKDEYTCNMVDQMYADNLLSSDGNGGVDWYEANAYDYGRQNKGYIANYDFSLSGSIHDRVFLGFTFGIQDVHYKSHTLYTESMVATGSNPLNTIAMESQEKITGVGVNATLGAIFLPIENNPFRIGAWVSTPTMYNLDLSESLAMTASGTSTTVTGYATLNRNDLRFNTPWKFGMAVGSTFGRNFAFDVEYEYANYGNTDARYEDGEYWDYYYGYTTSTSSDDEMNRNVEQSLKGVSTFKVGLEYKPISDIAVRLGYNYVSPMYETDGFRDPSAYSFGNWSSVTTDYTNWKSTNRFTLGLGFNVTDHFNIDVAYQYAQTNGVFYPFTSYSSSSMENLCSVSDVKNQRHQLLLSMSYKF